MPCAVTLTARDVVDMSAFHRRIVERETIVDEFTDMDVMYEALSDEKVTAAAHGLAGKEAA